MLTLAVMAPYVATKPVAAQAPAALVVQIVSPTAGVALTRTRTRWQAGTGWMAMAMEAAEAKAKTVARLLARIASLYVLALFLGCGDTIGGGDAGWDGSACGDREV